MHHVAPVGLIVPPSFTKSVSLESHSLNATDLTNYSFASQSIGAADDDRYLVSVLGAVAITGAPTVSSATIAGAASSKVAGTTNGNDGLELWITDAPVTTGTTGTIAANWSTTCRRAFHATFRLILPSNTVTASGTSTASPGSLGLATVADGVAVFLAFNNSLVTNAWANATEANDTQNDGATYSAATAATDGSTPTVTCTYTGTTTDQIMIGATF